MLMSEDELLSPRCRDFKLEFGVAGVIELSGEQSSINPSGLE